MLLWYRRDLRIADNPALAAALNAAKTVVSLNILGLKPPVSCSATNTGLQWRSDITHAW